MLQFPAIWMESITCCFELLSINILYLLRKVSWLFPLIPIWCRHGVEPTKIHLVPYISAIHVLHRMGCIKWLKSYIFNETMINVRSNCFQISYIRIWWKRHQSWMWLKCTILRKCCSFAVSCVWVSKWMVNHVYLHSCNFLLNVLAYILYSYLYLTITWSCM